MVDYGDPGHLDSDDLELAPRFSRSGGEIALDLWTKLRALPEYFIVREFASKEYGLFLRVDWVGLLNREFFVSKSAGDKGSSLYFSTEQEAINYYEHELAASGRGEWVTDERGTSYMLEIGNDSEYACLYDINKSRELDRLHVLEMHVESGATEFAGSW